MTYSAQQIAEILVEGHEETGRVNRTVKELHVVPGIFGEFYTATVVHEQPEVRKKLRDIQDAVKDLEQRGFSGRQTALFLQLYDAVLAQKLEQRATCKAARLNGRNKSARRTHRHLSKTGSCKPL